MTSERWRKTGESSWRPTPMIVKPAKAQQTQRSFFSSVHDRFSAINQWLLEKIHRSVGRPPVRLRLENGLEVTAAGALPVATHPSALRFEQRFLSALARPPACVFLRVFPFCFHEPGRSAGRQDGLHLPQAEPPARRACCGYRLRVGGALLLATWRSTTA